MSSADDVPDLVPSVLAATAAARTQASRRNLVARAALLLVSVVQLVLAAPSLLDGSDDAMHLTHEVGAFNAALAVGLVWVVFRPHRAVGLLPLLTALVGLLVAVTIPDLLVGHVHWERESLHVLLVVALGLLGALARATTTTQPPRLDSRTARSLPPHGTSTRAEAA